MSLTWDTERTMFLFLFPRKRIQVIVSVLVLYHYYKLPQFYWLSHSSVSQNSDNSVIKLKSRCPQGCVPSDVLEMNQLPSLFMLLADFSSMWMQHSRFISLLLVSQGSFSTSRGYIPWLIALFFHLSKPSMLNPFQALNPSDLPFCLFSRAMPWATYLSLALLTSAAALKGSHDYLDSAR